MLASKLALCHTVSSNKIERNNMKKIVLGIVIILSTPSFALTLEKQVEYIDKVKSFSDTQRTIKITAGIFELIWQCSVAGIKDTFFAGIQDIADNSTDDFSFGGLLDSEKTNREKFLAGVDEAKKIKIINDYQTARRAIEDAYGKEGQCTDVFDKLMINLGLINQENVETIFINNIRKPIFNQIENLN